VPKFFFGIKNKKEDIFQSRNSNESFYNLLFLDKIDFKFEDGWQEEKHKRKTKFKRTKSVGKFANLFPIGLFEYHITYVFQTEALASETMTLWKQLNNDQEKAKTSTDP
jgi:hypothetical protein